MKSLIFMGDSKESLSGFPDEVKPFKGYPGVMEIVSPYKKETYRAVYALKIGRIYTSCMPSRRRRSMA